MEILGIIGVILLIGFVISIVANIQSGILLIVLLSVLGSSLRGI